MFQSRAGIWQWYRLKRTTKAAPDLEETKYQSAATGLWELQSSWGCLGQVLKDHMGYIYLCLCALAMDPRPGNGEVAKQEVRLWTAPRYFCLLAPATLWCHPLFKLPTTEKAHERSVPQEPEGMLTSSIALLQPWAPHSQAAEVGQLPLHRACSREQCSSLTWEEMQQGCVHWWSLFWSSQEHLLHLQGTGH